MTQVGDGCLKRSHLAVFDVNFHHGRKLLSARRVNDLQHDRLTIERDLFSVAVFH